MHQVLQVAFNWYDSHLHSFFVNKTDGKRADNLEIDNPDRDDVTDLFGGQVYQGKEETLADWFIMPKDKTTYVYDFGDDWNHEIVFSKKITPENAVNYPRCTSAKNLAPDENPRWEVIQGEVDLSHPDGKQLAREVIEGLHNMLEDMLTSYGGEMMPF